MNATLPVIRHLLQLIGGFLIAKGVLSAEEASSLADRSTEALGAAISLGTLFWMIRAKRRAPAPVAPVLLAAGLLGLAVGGVGCSAVKAGNDPVLVNAERTVILAVDVFDTFTQWEYDNRTALAPAPEIRKAADFIRLKGEDWLTTALAMTDAYRQARTPDNKANLQTSLEVLRAGIREAQRYITAGAPPPIP